MDKDGSQNKSYLQEKYLAVLQLHIILADRRFVFAEDLPLV